MASKKIMINDEVIFCENLFELRSLSSQGDVITLNAPTARCLQLLLDKAGQVVSRDDFLTQVWQARGIVVSQNTFYQNISLLRKSLKDAGLTKDIIVTVRRKGFILAEDTIIRPVIDEDILQASIETSVPFHAVKRQEEVISSDIVPQNEEIKAKKTGGMQVPQWLVLLIMFLIAVEIISLVITYMK